MKPVVYPEGVGNCPVLHKCLWITYEWRSRLQDPECLLQFCWFVTLHLFSEDLDANTGISPWKISSEVWQKQKKNGGDLSKLSADVLPLSKKQEGIRGLSTYGYLHFVCHNRAWEGRVYGVLSWRWRCKENTRGANTSQGRIIHWWQMTLDFCICYQGFLLYLQRKEIWS